VEQAFSSSSVVLDPKSLRSKDEDEDEHEGRGRSTENDGAHFHAAR